MNFNARIALKVSRIVSDMRCAYAFAMLALLGIPGVPESVRLVVIWISQTFVQLVMLSVLAVVQDVQGQRTEARDNETNETVKILLELVREEIGELKEIVCGLQRIITDVECGAGESQMGERDGFPLSRE